MKTAAFALGLFLLAVAGDASAAEVTALKELKALPAPSGTVDVADGPKPFTGLTIADDNNQRGATWRTYSATGSYCLLSHTFGVQMSTSYVSYAPDGDEVDLVRLLPTKDGALSLERTRFVASNSAITMKGRSSVVLTPVAKSGGVEAFAYRDGADVVVLSRQARNGSETPRISPDGDFTGPPFVSSECGFVQVRLAGASASGAVALLAGDLPAKDKAKSATKETFAVHASVTRVARDDDAMLAVRILRHE